MGSKFIISIESTPRTVDDVKCIFKLDAHPDRDAVCREILEAVEARKRLVSMVDILDLFLQETDREAALKRTIDFIGKIIDQSPSEVYIMEFHGDLMEHSGIFANVIHDRVKIREF